ncbi:MAG: hypothetical protein AAFX94_00895, partial [Myxococcota bacterium]
ARRIRVLPMSPSRDFVVFRTGVVETTEPIGSKRIAIDIGASVRAVQNELQILAEDRMCRRLKVGREVMYSVEDTTFKAPTQERWLRHSGRD